MTQAVAEHDDDALGRLARRVAVQLLTAGRRLAVAESCTGGWIAKVLTDIPGSSQWFERGYVTYSNSAKQQALGVSPEVITTFGAVSQPTVEQMAAGALHASEADLAVAVTGIAGPEGGTSAKPVGLVWFALACRNGAIQAMQRHFPGDRDAVRRAAVAAALELIAAPAAQAPAAP